MASIPIPKAPVKIINTFSSEQLKKILSICNTNDHYGLRNSTIILLMLDNSIRVSELVNINISDISPTDGYIKIRVAKGAGKGLCQ